MTGCLSHVKTTLGYRMKDLLLHVPHPCLQPFPQYGSPVPLIFRLATPQNLGGKNLTSKSIGYSLHVGNEISITYSMSEYSKVKDHLQSPKREPLQVRPKSGPQRDDLLIKAPSDSGARTEVTANKKNERITPQSSLTENKNYVGNADNIGCIYAYIYLQRIVFTTIIYLDNMSLRHTHSRA